VTVASLTILLALLAGSAAEGHGHPRRITLLTPSWTAGEISMDARLLVLVNVVSSEMLEEVWLEVRTAGGGWERRADASRLPLSPLEIVAGVAIEPRRIPGIEAGGQFEVRIRSTYRNGEADSSPSLEIRVAEAERREEDLLNRLSECHRGLDVLLEDIEEDYRRLCRLERRPVGGEAEDRSAPAELAAMEERWNERTRAMLHASKELGSILDDAVTDRFVDSAREAQYRRIPARLRAWGLEKGMGTSVRRNLARVRRAVGRDERREAFHASLDAQDQFIEALKRTVAELKAWRGNVDLRRNVRLLLQTQKGVNGELERARDRNK